MKTFLLKAQRKLYRILWFPIMRWLVLMFPIQKKRIVLDNFGGKGLGGNPRYIAEELLRRRADVELIWLLDNLSEESFPPDIKPVKIDSVKALYMRATAKIWVDKVRHLHPVKKRKGQVYLQTWHGASFTLKQIEKDALTLDVGYVREAMYDGSITDSILTSGKFMEQIYKRAFWLKEDVQFLRYGWPPDDLLLKSANNLNLRDEIKQKYGISPKAYCVLYAPTFRDDLSLDGYHLDFEKIRMAFSKKTNRECFIIVKLHPNVLKQANDFVYTDHVLNGSVDSDSLPLTLAADCIISDYSSYLFDFALLGKPALICALDYQAYQKTRGLTPEFNALPFPMALSNDELIACIERFDETRYLWDIQAFFQENPVYGHGDAAGQTAEWILKQMD